ncbi:MAG: hypothetical protein AAFO03_07435 [Bacteroidota bacterium]
MIHRILHHNHKHIVLYGVLIFLLGLLIAYSIDNSLLPGILMVLGMELTFLELLRRYLVKQSSIKLLGAAILVLSVLNFLRHAAFLKLIPRIRELYVSYLEVRWYLITESIWLMISIWIAWCGLKLLFSKEVMSFGAYTASKEFSVLALLILFLFDLEIPVFGLHGNFGGYVHGHSFWDSASHLH